MMKLSAVCLALLIVIGVDLGGADTSGQWSSPDGKYQATWNLNTGTDMINVTITCQQASGTWCAIAFGPDNLMQNQDVIFGYVDGNGVGHVYDAWVGAHYTLPVVDTVQNIQSASISYTNGVYTMSFSRPRASSDTTQDVSFSDTNSYYFKYPVGGGLMNGDAPQKHTQTPTVSASTICVCSAGTASTTSAGGSSVGSTLGSSGSGSSASTVSSGQSSAASQPSSSTNKPSSALPGSSFSKTIIILLAGLAVFYCL